MKIGFLAVYIYKVDSPVKDKLESLSLLLRSLGDQSTIVFLNYRGSVRRTNKYLVEQGFSTSFFHGGLEQEGTRGFSLSFQQR